MWFVAVEKTHMDSEDLARFRTAPDFWDDEPTARVAICPHCVHLANRCVCPVTVELNENDLEEMAP